MELTSRQVAKILGVSISTISKLVISKTLRDIGHTANGGKRHQLRFDSKEIREFAKTYQSRSKSSRIIQSSNSPVMKIDTLINTIRSLEAKVDRLISMWS